MNALSDEGRQGKLSIASHGEGPFRMTAEGMPTRSRSIGEGRSIGGARGCLLRAGQYFLYNLPATRDGPAHEGVKCLFINPPGRRA